MVDIGIHYRRQPVITLDPNALPRSRRAYLRDLSFSPLRPIAVADTPEGKLVYYPGLACSDFRRHTDHAATLTNAFVTGSGEALGPNCIAHGLGYVPSVTPTHSTHWMPRWWWSDPDSTALRSTWSDLVARKYWKVFRVFCLLDQIMVMIGCSTPHAADSAIIDLFLKTKTTAMSPRTRKIILGTLRSYGVGDIGDWDKELADNEALFTQWRDDIFRCWVLCDVLRAISGARNEEMWYRTVEGFDSDLKTAESLSTHTERRPLTAKQRRLVETVEGRYLKERLKYTGFQCAVVLRGTRRDVRAEV